MRSVCSIRDERERVYSLTHPHVFLKLPVWFQQLEDRRLQSRFNTCKFSPQLREASARSCVDLNTSNHHAPRCTFNTKQEHAEQHTSSQPWMFEAEPDVLFQSIWRSDCSLIQSEKLLFLQQSKSRTVIRERSCVKKLKSKRKPPQSVQHSEDFCSFSLTVAATATVSSHLQILGNVKV